VLAISAARACVAFAVALVREHGKGLQEDVRARGRQGENTNAA
jgi:hypothetical protein